MNQRVRQPRGKSIDYRGSLIAVGTRHGKQLQFAPAFAAVLGARVIAPPDLDTDKFGTFPGEVPRTMSALDTARAKALLAVQASGSRYALASEASYGPLPGTGIPGHEELLVFIDHARGIELVEGYRTTAIPGFGQRIRDFSDLKPGIVGALPDQALIVRPSVDSRPGDIVKGITTTERLQGAVISAAGRSSDGLALVEPDLRAHHNPTRRQVLARLAETMAHRLATRCPGCSAPGFGRVDTEPGLPCRACATPTPLSRHQIHSCSVCTHDEIHPVAEPAADPRWCPECNP
ncbi:MAG: hypothetical protein KDB71_10505 [Mycobacterium sp.]|nr:hypothetical protein [Mycobacterium sp.]